MDGTMNKLRRVWTIINVDRRIKSALISFLLTTTSIVFIENGKSLLYSMIHAIILLILIHSIVGIKNYKFSIQGFICGLIYGTSISMAWYYGSSNWKILIFCLYTYLFSIFHFSEFFVTGLINADSLRPDSFLLNHSTAYWIAASASWTEYFIEYYLFPYFYSPTITLIGFLMCISGEVMRKLAMIQAGSGFTHQIAIRKQKNHTLITNGVYGVCRHPGYLGWYLWAVGTQLILCNPICAIIYAYITYSFFEDRILEEERYLTEFFGQRYITYQRNVRVGIPGIEGFPMP